MFNNAFANESVAFPFWGLSRSGSAVTQRVFRRDEARLKAVETRGVGFEWEFYARKANSGLLY